MSLNDAWRFIPEDRQDADNPGQDDSQWQVVDVPHTWNASDPFDDAPGYRRGQGWYRKRIAIDPQLKEKRIFVFFEGVHQKADVFVNNRLVGSHRGGYTALCYDVTKLISFKGENPTNLLAVRADGSWQSDIAPLDIGYAHYGGIYRDVWLIATDPVHFELTDHASPGVKIDTPQVSAQSATLRVRGTVVNDTDRERSVGIRLTLADANGNRINHDPVLLKVPASGKAQFEQTIQVAKPKLWSPDAPNLYYPKVTIEDGGKTLDEYTTHTGFRWFKFDPKDGFFINGKHLALRGASRHQDYQGLGSALPNSIHRSDLRWIKDMGGNFIRIAHYPQDPEVLDTADRIGLIAWEEVPLVSIINSSPEFAATSKNMLIDMIRQHYNHPAVVMWGYMNEPLLNWGRQEGRDPEFPNEVKKLATELEAVVHQEDTTRVSTTAMNLGESYDKAGIGDIPQVAGWNVYFGWYNDTFAELGKFFDKQHEKYPKRVLFLSEYGAGSDERLHSLKPQRFDHSAEWMRMYHEAHLRQLAKRPYIAGVAIWNEFDFSQPEAADSMVHVNQKGMLTWDRRPKDVYYLYQANWSEKPMLHIASREWTYRSGTKPDAKDGAGPQAVESPVQIYSNLDEVELSLDGKSLGKKKPDDVKSAIWQVPLHDGWNLLEARGKRGDEQIRDSVRIHFKYQAPHLADPSVPFDEIAVNAGGNVSYNDPQNLIWLPDQPYTRGGWGYVGDKSVDHWKAVKPVIREDILGTTEDPVYQAFREGADGYRFDVPDGDYELELRFTEYFPKKPGERVFRVMCNGLNLIYRLDLTEAYGLRRAASRTFKVEAKDGKGLQIHFEAVAGKSIVSALRVRKIK
jgi:beta-galactosidase